MLTGVISCRTGITKAPPLTTTFSPRKPVLTNAVSFVEAAVQPPEHVDGDDDDDRRDDEPNEKVSPKVSAAMIAFLPNFIRSVRA